MTFLLTVGVVCLAFALIFGLTDRYEDDPTDDEFIQSKHCRLLTDQEPSA